MLYRVLFVIPMFIGLYFLVRSFVLNDDEPNKWNTNPQATINERRELITGKKISRIAKFKADAELALRLSNSKLSWEQFEIVSAVSAIIGIIIGIILNNFLLSIIMAGVMVYIPVAILQIKQHTYSMYTNEQLQSALQSINTAYVKSDDIHMAVKENLHRIDEPLNTIFRDFVASNLFIDGNISKNIMIMKNKINNRFFHEWCDYLILSQTDRNMKYVLLTIVQEMSEVKNLQEELKTVMFNIYKEFAMIAGIVILAVPAMSILNHNWYVYLTNTTVGKIVVAIAYLVTFLSFIHVVKVNKPIDSL